jgi:hypothetical protein
MLSDCKSASTQVSVPDGQPVVFFLFAAFDNFASPQIKACSFGIEYSSPLVAPINSGGLQDPAITLPDVEWPLSGSGTALSWLYPLTRQINEIYWFAAYSYSGNWLKVTGHPRLGGEFVDDSHPPVSDWVADVRTGGYYSGEYFGMIGFNREGNNPCNPDEATGACCSRAGQCIVQTRAGCGLFAGYTYLGDDTPCRPNPCEPGIGACCIDGECFLMQWDACIGTGTWVGEGVGCDPSPCGFGSSESTWGVLKTKFDDKR